MKKLTCLAASVLMATGAQASEADREIGYTRGALGYEALMTGDNDIAVKQLEKSYKSSKYDPAKMINLGQAYARAGRFAEATEMFQAAIENKRHFDVELSDGRILNTRDAARMAMKRLRLKMAVR